MSLIEATKKNYISIVRELLATDGACVYETDGAEWTALIWASNCCDKEIVEILLNHDNSHEHINHKSISGFTALMYASQEGHKEIVEILLNHDNSLEHINRQNNRGLTALMMASSWGRKEIVELLLEHDANLNILNKKGYLAVDIAKTEEIKELLLNWEPKGVIRAKGA